MSKYPNPIAGPQATEQKNGSMRFANSTEAADTTRDDLALSPARLSGALDTYVPDATTTVEGKVQLATDAEAQARSSSSNIALVPANLAAEGFLQWADVSITSAEVKALETTQITLVAAQGANTLIKFMGATLKLAYGGTNAFTEAGDNLAIKYTDDSGVAVSQTIETTGFIDQTADTYTNAEPAIDAIVAASAGENAPLVLDNLGSAIAGNAANDNTLEVRVFYQVMSI